MKRILFVDDEVSVLDGIRTMLRKRRKEWHMEFVTSGADALKSMEAGPFDLICSDMRMPMMDGSQLLAAIRERWPNTIRVVLSGYSEIMQTAKSLPVAQLVLSKPCNAQQLQSTVERSLALREVLNKSALRELLARARLPALPPMTACLREATATSSMSAAEVAKLIASDLKVFGMVMKIANLPSFRLAREVTDIEQAISQLGFPAIRNLVLSVEVLALWPNDDTILGRTLEDFSSNALQVSALTRALSSGTGFFDDAIVAGMLREIGYLVLHSISPLELSSAHRLAREKRISLAAAERETFGASHSEVGAALLADWGLPFNVVEAVAHHHDAMSVTHTEYDLLSALSLALVLAHGPHDEFGCRSAHTVNADALSKLCVPFTLERAHTTTAEVKSAFAE
jgi:HD-like signal output (HDOD) protein